MGDFAALFNLGELENILGNHEQAKALFLQNLVLTKELNDADGICDSLLGLGKTESLQSNYRQAFDAYKEALVIAREKGIKLTIVLLLNLLGDIALEIGDYLQAQLYVEESMKIAQSAGYTYAIAHCYLLIGKLARYKKNYQDGLTMIYQSLAMIHDVNYDKSFLGYILLEFIAQDVNLNKFTEAVHLFGAIEETLPLIYNDILPTSRAEYERIIALTHAKLGEKTYKVFHAEGRAMTMEQAIEYVLKEPEK